jgi:hypothetical protein
MGGPTCALEVAQAAVGVGGGERAVGNSREKTGSPSRKKRSSIAVGPLANCASIHV